MLVIKKPGSGSVLTLKAGYGSVLTSKAGSGSRSGFLMRPIWIRNTGKATSYSEDGEVQHPGLALELSEFEPY